MQLFQYVLIHFLKWLYSFYFEKIAQSIDIQKTTWYNISAEEVRLYFLAYM